MITELFKVSATGAIQIWSIRSFYKLGELHIMYGQMNGAMQQQTVKVEVNQSGRTLPEQVELESDSRINTQLDKGYRYSIQGAKSSIGKNAMGLLRPMLAKKLCDVKGLKEREVFYQYKYNGNRCLIACTDGGIVAYSRNGKLIKTADHIISGMALEPGDVVDGELYKHGIPIQDLGSMIRKKQDSSLGLQLVAYDLISTMTYERRLDKLISMKLGKHVVVAPTKFGSNINSLKEEMSIAKELGYEGIMLRTNDKGYEAGKRSSSLIKVKEAMDAEFMVTDVHASKDGWAILECSLGNKASFRVPAPGTIEEKVEILLNADNYIGLFVNVSFFEHTNDGKPFHAVANYFREVE